LLYEAYALTLHPSPLSPVKSMCIFRALCAFVYAESDECLSTTISTVALKNMAYISSSVTEFSYSDTEMESAFTSACSIGTV
ncbi:unnamed protein product, partial [Sphenostylis stenocarpa]